MRHSFRLLGTSAIVFALTAGAVMAQEACKSYRVVPGDTLLKIAERAYGTDNYRMIYNANSDRLSNPNLIEVGELLQLPCADGSLAAAEPVLVPEVTEAAKEAAAADTGPIVLITGNDFPPFTDESLPGRGVFTQLVETAAYRGDRGRQVEVQFVNDWESHLDLLLPVLAFNGSFPWSKPECDAPATLSEHDRNRCENYLFSDPFYEVVDGFFARKGSGFEDALKYEDLFGARFCRPEGYSTAHLDAAGLSEPMVKMYRPAQVADCFEALMAGSVDVIAMDSMVAADTIASMGLTEAVVENQNLGAVKELYVLVHKNHPRGQETLDLLNTGLRQMVSSGEWYDIVSQALQRQMTSQVN